MRFFQKINLNLDTTAFLNIDINSLERYSGDYEFKEVFEAGPKTQLLKLPNSLSNSITDQLPVFMLEKEIPKILLGQFLNLDPSGCTFPIHIDRGRRCSINTYIKCNYELTKFYSKENNNYVLENEFIANAGETWILDVSKPHCVEMPTVGERLMITIGYRNRFEDLVKNW